MKRFHLLSAITLLVGSAAWLGCTVEPDSPRDRVIDFVRLVQVDSLADIVPFMDIDSVAGYLYASAKYDSLDLTEKKNKLLRDFVKDGHYRQMITKSQIVVNEEQLLDDTTATVEVSYIDLSSRIQYYTQMGLKLRDSIWVISNMRIE